MRVPGFRAGMGGSQSRISLDARGCESYFRDLRIPSIQDGIQSPGRSSDEPLRILRITVGLLLLLGSAVAVVLALSGIAPGALQLVGMFWAIYGFIVGLTSGVLEPAVEGLARALSDLGLIRGGGGFSAIETLVVRGDFASAAEAYRERAQQPLQRVEATVRRAGLLAGPLQQPETAVVELESLRKEKLSPGEDLRVGVALVDLYERRLADPGRAMAELRRLIDLYPGTASARRLRRALGELKRQHVPAPPV